MLFVEYLITSANEVMFYQGLSKRIVKKLGFSFFYKKTLKPRSPNFKSPKVPKVHIGF